MKTRTAAYIRVSTVEQKLHGYSLDAQRDTLKRYAESHDLEIVLWYEDEGVSGRKEIKKRPALQRMLQDAEKELFKRLIFIKLDRFFRSVGEYYACQKILDAHGILWSATNEEYDLTTATGRLLVSQKLAVAEYESDTTGERIRLVNEYKIRQGNAVTGPQSLHIGFAVANTPNGKKVVHDPEKEHIAKDILDTFRRTQSLRRTVIEINTKYGLNIQSVNLKAFLRDTKLYGFYRGNENYCEPYIAKEEYDEIQNIIPRNIKVTPSKRIYLFSGLMRCPNCGNMLIANHSKGNSYYRCTKAFLHGNCVYTKNISEISIERQLLDTLNGMIGNYIREIEARSISKKETDTAPVKKEMERLNKMFQKGRISEKDYDREYESLRIQLAEMEKLNAGGSDLANLYEMLQHDWKEQYAMLDQANKQSFWRNLIQEIVITKERVIEKVLFF